MAVQTAAMVSIAVPVHSESNLWLDAFSRLIHNRAAVVGLVIIAILLLTAIFAPNAAPSNYSDGDSAANNMVPGWFLSIFPNMAGYARLNNAYLFGADYLGRDIFS